MLVDENLPPALAKALAALFPRRHEIIHLRDRFQAGVTDLEWINLLDREGSWVVLSADKRISRNKAERQAFKSSRLVALIMAPGLGKAPVTKKMERLMANWGNIEKQVEILSGGSMVEIQAKGTKFKTL
jgi:hypothetical protein